MILGPCPCHRCGRMLYYDGFHWRLWRGKRAGHSHVTCRQRAA